jgi:hypothetical protein
MTTQPTSREHWHTRATHLVQLDCVLLNLLPDDDRNLSKLPPELYTLALKKLDELVTGCCRAQGNGADDGQLLEQLAKDVWNFLKPWKCAELAREPA